MFRKLAQPRITACLRILSRAHAPVLVETSVFSVLGYWELSGQGKGDDRETERMSSKPTNIPPLGPKLRGLEVMEMLPGRACWFLSLGVSTDQGYFQWWYRPANRCGKPSPRLRLRVIFWDRKRSKLSAF